MVIKIINGHSKSFDRNDENSILLDKKMENSQVPNSDLFHLLPSLSVRAKARLGATCTLSLF